MIALRTEVSASVAERLNEDPGGVEDAEEILAETVTVEDLVLGGNPYAVDQFVGDEPFEVGVVLRR